MREEVGNIESGEEVYRISRRVSPGAMLPSKSFGKIFFCSHRNCHPLLYATVEEKRSEKEGGKAGRARSTSYS